MREIEQRQKGLGGSGKREVIVEWYFIGSARHDHPHLRAGLSLLSRQ